MERLSVLSASLLLSIMVAGLPIVVHANSRRQAYSRIRGAVGFHLNPVQRCAAFLGASRYLTTWIMTATTVDRPADRP